MKSKELVRNAVHFSGNGIVPILYFNKNKERSDAIFVTYDTPSDFKPKVEGESEWGFVWETVDGTMGQPQNPPLKNGYDLWPDIKKPDPNDKTRYEEFAKTVEANKDKYIIGNLEITGFNMLTFIRGFEETLEDLYLNPEDLIKVFEEVVRFESEVARNMCAFDTVDCIAFGDDWGTQTALMVSPEMFRKFFKPYYKKQFDLVHSYGKDVFFHCCGQIKDIIDDLIEIGVNILNLNQPDIFPLEYLEKYKGKVCFNCPVDHQTVAIHGNRDEIFDYVKKLYQFLATDKGGLIANVEEYKSVGMSDENYSAICEAFELLKAGELKCT